MRDPVSQAEVASLGASGASLEEEGCGQAEKGNPASSQFLLWKPLETLRSLLSCLHGSTLLTPGTAYWSLLHIERLWIRAQILVCTPLLPQPRAYARPHAGLLLESLGMGQGSPLQERWTVGDITR